MQVREAAEGEIARQLPAEDWHLAVCVDVLDAELKTGPRGGDYYSERIVFQLETRKQNGDRFIVGRNLTLTPLPKGGASLSKKTKELLATWLGKRHIDQLTDTKMLVGRSANLQIVHQNGWANIAALDPPTRDLSPEPYVRRTKEDREAWQAQRRNGSSTEPDTNENVPF